LLDQTTRLLSTMTDVRLACVNVNKISTVFMNDPFDENGQNVHIKRLVELKDWARPIALASDKISFHVLENIDPAEALIDFAKSNHADQILMCARGAGNYRRFLGSVSSQVVARAPCTVTVVRAPSPVGEKPAAENELAT
jgi:nucleotide-binding universal stress UspA family protein